MGVEIFAPYDTDKIRINKEIGGFNIQAFQVPHGETLCYGMLIKHSNGEKLLYVTDLEYCRYIFQACNVNHFLVECNYQDGYIDLDAPNKEHKISGHASLKTCKELIKANVTPYMQSVILIHLGKGSTNPQECVSEIESVVSPNVSVDYARPNTVYELKGKVF